jgi:hypothetical protein
MIKQTSSHIRTGITGSEDPEKYGNHLLKNILLYNCISIYYDIIFIVIK